MISVVIATYNRRALLERTLRALEEQSLPRDAFEVIVADNGSTDGTGALLDEFRSRGRLDIRVRRVMSPGKSAALNAAVTHARGDVIAFTDDDVVPEAGWLEAFASAFAAADTDFAAGRIFPHWESPPPGWVSPALYGVLAVPDGGPERRRLSAAGDTIMPIGANMAVRRAVIDQIGGWRTDLGALRGTLRTGEDHEFYMRMRRAGCRGVYEPAARVRHFVPAERLQRSYFRKWFYGNGRIVALLEHEFPTTGRYLLSVPRYLWGAAFRDLWRAVRPASRHDAATRFAAVMQLVWFGGYLRQAWGSVLGPAPRFSAQTSSSC